METADVLKSNSKRVFLDIDDIKDFLKEMESLDETVVFQLSTIKTYVDDGISYIEGSQADGTRRKIPLWNFSLDSLEDRSEDNAKGHSKMSEEQILNSMNNYWGLHGKKLANARIRGEKLMSLDSPQYATISQSSLVNSLVDWLDAHHDYSFKNGYYTHLMTEIAININDPLSVTYQDAWRKAGLPESILNNTNLTLKFRTNDIAESAATAYIELNVFNTPFILNEPVTIIHRKGHGGIESFEDKLSKMDSTVEDELKGLSNLLGIKLIHPMSAMVTAMKKAGLDKLSLKACKELEIESGSVFCPLESAYMVYLQINKILNTFYGSGLSETMKFRILNAARGLVHEDWTKFDIPHNTFKK